MAPDQVAAGPASAAPAEAHGHAGRFWPLALGAVGVVYGDIGTSPLYAFRLAMVQAARGGVTSASIIGVVSLAIWTLILVVTIKYVLFLMRADNRGEGGVLSLMALAERAVGRRTMLIFFLGVAGAALFYGDAAITPAISVLSAIEGVRSIPALTNIVSPTGVMVISMTVLVILFAIQSGGTSRVAAFFGPIMVIWFLSIAALGVYRIGDGPAVLNAFNPMSAVSFVATHGMIGFLVLGAVFLTVTGAEALFADMGHFGRWPIQAAWLFLAFPCLVLNYLGQGAFALHALAQAHAAHRPLGDIDWFFTMMPEALRIPMVILATAATVIASQAVITGAFSLTQQAIQLGLLPRMTMRNTSASHAGQIFLPTVNQILAIGVLFLVASFKTSAALGDAYGLAVTGTMVVTTILAFIVVRRMWKWPLAGAAAFIAPLIFTDLVFLSSNALKIPTGGWLPLTIAGAMMLVMGTWVRGSRILFKKGQDQSVPMKDLRRMLKLRPPFRIHGAAVFLTSDPDSAPPALMHNMKHNKVFHDTNILLTVRTARTPRTEPADRVTYERLDDNFVSVVATYGFMEQPSVPDILVAARAKGLDYDPMSTSFFLGRRSIAASASSKVPGWQRKLYAFLHKNASDPTAYFNIPAGRVVEMGAQISL